MTTALSVKKKTFVCGGDANYFPLMLEWLHSVRRFKTLDDFDICILDSGLTEAQIEILKPHVNAIHKPDWPCDIATSRIKGREYLKSCVCRPFINQYFKGYDLYFWMDCDVWLQSDEAIPLFVEGAKRRKIALVPQVDRAYMKQIRVKWLGALPIKIRGFYYTNALKAYGHKRAKQLLPYSVLSAGAFALHKDAPHWDHWQKLIIKTLQKGKVFTAEQLSLGVMCYLDGLPFEALPSWTHWLCEFKPLYDTKNKRFVEPFLPHKTLSILHLSGVDEMRMDRNVTDEFETTDGETISLSYRYPDFNGNSSGFP